MGGKRVNRKPIVSDRRDPVKSQSIPRSTVLGSEKIHKLADTAQDMNAMIAQLLLHARYEEEGDRVMLAILDEESPTLKIKRKLTSAGYETGYKRQPTEDAFVYVLSAEPNVGLKMCERMRKQAPGLVPEDQLNALEQAIGPKRPESWRSFR